MIEKIIAARQAAAGTGAPNLVVNARTDVLTARPNRTEGLREAIERGNDYLDAGADLVFVIGVDALADAQQLAKEIRGPVSIAAGVPSNISSMSIGDLGECGVARVSLPSLAVFAGLRAVKEVLSIVAGSGDFRKIIEKHLLCNMGDVAEVLAR